MARRRVSSDKYLDYTAAMRKHTAVVEAEKDKFVEAYPGYCAAAPQSVAFLAELGGQPA